jgi:hypothetical protein
MNTGAELSILVPPHVPPSLHGGSHRRQVRTQKKPGKTGLLMPLDALGKLR